MAQEIDSLKSRLNIIISLLLMSFSGGKPNSLALQDKVVFLNSFGLENKEIAEILGKSTNHISKELSSAKKTKRK